MLTGYFCSQHRSIRRSRERWICRWHGMLFPFHRVDLLSQSRTRNAWTGQLRGTSSCTFPVYRAASPLWVTSSSSTSRLGFSKADARIAERDSQGWRRSVFAVKSSILGPRMTFPQKIQHLFCLPLTLAWHSIGWLKGRTLLEGMWGKNSGEGNKTIVIRFFCCRKFSEFQFLSSHGS
jgi:hypothetical protein